VSRLAAAAATEPFVTDKNVTPVRENERRQGGAHGHEPQAYREERGALRGPEALAEVDLWDVLSHQGANRDPGEGVHDAGNVRAPRRRE
jgi:hypothetical protein